MDLGESIKPHFSRWATTGDRLMVENADSMADPAKKETEARFLPLSTYSVLGKKFVSVVSENNFGLSFATSWGGPRNVRLTTVRFFHLWTRQCNCRVLLKRAGATPRTFWAAESRKSGVAPARFCSLNSAAFHRRLPTGASIPVVSGIGR
jgi:hypothetical protein